MEVKYNILRSRTAVYSSTAFKISLLLRCTKSNQSEKSEIKLESLPQNILEIKKLVEKEFGIPKCVQVISCNNQTLEGDTKLSALRFREGDTVYVDYLAKGDCSDIKEVISWLDQLSKAVRTRSSALDDTIRIGIQQRLIEDLRTCFVPWEDPRTYVNKLHFVDSDGIEMILKVYDFLLQRPWSQLDPNSKCLEGWVIRSLWDFAETFPLRRLMVQHGIIQMLTQSLLRVRLEEGKRIHDYDVSGSRYQQSLLVETIFGSVGALLNIIELPECQLEIAKNRDILHQLSCVSLAPSLNPICSQMIALFFGNLAFTPQTHQYITDSVYFYRLFRACGKFSMESEDGALLKYFSVLFLMQVCLISPHCIQSDWYKIIMDTMESLLQANSFTEIRDIEIERGFNCSIFIPYVKLVYLPNALQTDSLLGKLQLVSLQLAIFSLQNMLGRQAHRELLQKEGLLDFVICMPQYVPPSLRPQAEELVQMVVSSPDIPEGPPKLLNLVKARLAKMHFGLERILSLSVSEIVSRHFLGSQCK